MDNDKIIPFSRKETGKPDRTYYDFEIRFRPTFGPGEERIEPETITDWGCLLATGGYYGIYKIRDDDKYDFTTIVGSDDVLYVRALGLHE